MTVESTEPIRSLHLICAHCPRVVEFIGKPDHWLAAATEKKYAVLIAAGAEADPKRGLYKPLCHHEEPSRNEMTIGSIPFPHQDPPNPLDLATSSWTDETAKIKFLPYRDVTRCF
jgi:hypothetical protein